MTKVSDRIHEIAKKFKAKKVTKKSIREFIKKLDKDVNSQHKEVKP